MQLAIARNKQFLMSIRALIVDDSSVMRKIVERSIRQADIDLSQVFEGGNGAEALTVLKENAVDLILCDINMPVMDGLEFIKQLPGIENAKNVPVVMITTEGGEAHVVQAFSLGARGYIPKPFTPDQVKEHVVPVLAANHERGERVALCHRSPAKLASAA
jgi:two-component system, chemotaxis family, chemotaxis protein CheY